MNIKDQILKLKQEIEFLENDVNRLSCMEQAVKIVLNGGYGATGSAAFRWYDETIAEGITATGQVAIRFITGKINDFLNVQSNTENVDRVPSSDTDSCVYETILNTSIGNIAIGELYEKYTNESLELKTNKDSVRRLIEPIQSASFDGERVVFNNINYIMKHQVQKKMYKVTISNSSFDILDHVTITADHSIMVIRDNNLVSVTPSEIEVDDYLVYLNNDNTFILTNDWSISCLGIQDINVYDIEVEETHNFFGNNILLHNSVYFTVQDIVNRRWPEITDKQKITDNLDEFIENELSPYIESNFVDLTNYMNCRENKFDMKREAIADSFIIRAKKNYIMRVFDNEGTRFADPYYKMMGIEVVRTSHPQMIRDALEEALKIVIDGNVKQLREFVNNFRNEFMNAPLHMIAAPRGISDITKYQNPDYTKKLYELVMGDDGKLVKKKLTIPIHVFAAITYNNLVNSLKLANKWEYIRNGSKIKFLPLKEPNPLNSHVIGFVTDIPEEFGIDEYVDKESHFQKMFISPLETFTIYNNWTLEENALLDAFGSSVNIAASTLNAKKKPVAPKRSEIKTSSLF